MALQTTVERVEAHVPVTVMIQRPDGKDLALAGAEVGRAV